MSKIFWKALQVSPTFLGVILVFAKSVIVAEAHDAKTPQEPKAPTTDELTTISPPILLPQQLLEFDFQPNSISQPSHLLVRSEAVIEPLNITQPAYSQKASDLLLDTSSVSEKSRYYLSNPTPKNQISEAVTQQPSQPENPASDKSQYNLFNPTPRRLWREFSTDRPDKTETPFTVDAGRVTMEADLFVYTRDSNSPDGTRTESFNYFVPNFKVGLLNNIDLQIIPEVYNVVRTTPKNSPTQERSGFGDLTVRMKINFWGNDGGQTAFGMMPFIKFPTNQNNLGNNSIEGGVIFPLAIGLSDKWDVGMQTEFDFNKNEADAGYNVGFVNTVSFGYQINSRLSSYFELFTEARTESGSQFVATFDTGLKYLLTENVQLDAGVNIGLTEAADDLQPFMGLSVRF
ncbi:MAG TPA: transporter [Leptolyngbyaceae cyanobacterium]